MPVWLGPNKKMDRCWVTRSLISENRFLSIMMTNKYEIGRHVNPVSDTQVKLTGRDDLTLVCEGATNKEITEWLYISNHNVKDHIRHIMAKLGAKSRNRIVAAIKNHQVRALRSRRQSSNSFLKGAQYS